MTILFLCSGDSCVVDDAPGTCKFLKHCPSVYQQLLQGNPPTATCGFVRADPLVCCPEGEQPKTTTPSTKISTERSGPEPLIATRVARASELSHRKLQEVLFNKSTTMVHVSIHLCIFYLCSRMRGVREISVPVSVPAYPSSERETGKQVGLRDQVAHNDRRRQEG